MKFNDMFYFFAAEYLIGQFQSRRGTIPKIKNGLDITNPAITKLVKAVSSIGFFEKILCLKLNIKCIK